MASHRRGPWSQAEDAYLVQLIHTQGALNWVRIAQLIGSRSPKQCRERYHQNLKPSLNHEPISPAEGLQIERMVGEMGKRWAEIARRLHGRSDNAVKNWWNGSMNRRRRLVVRRSASSREPTEYMDVPEMHDYTHPVPTYQNNVAFDANYRSHRHHMSNSLPSPATSEVSRSDSMDGAPSLVSDSGSMYSISPRGALSPALELPPLAGVSSYPRRPSLPGLHIRNNNVSPEMRYQSHPYNSRIEFETKYPSDSPYSHRDSRPQHHAPVPATTIHLPPLQSLSITKQPERDGRMNLSSLLG